MAGRKTGRFRKLYYNSATYASPTWANIVKIGEVSVDFGKASTDIDIRESPNTKTVRGGNKKIVLKFTYYPVDGVADTILAALEASYWDDTALDIAATDIAIATAGAKGIRGPFVVTSRNEKQPPNGPIEIEYELSETDEYSSDGATLYSCDEYETAGS